MNIEAAEAPEVKDEITQTRIKYEDDIGFIKPEEQGDEISVKDEDDSVTSEDGIRFKDESTQDFVKDNDDGTPFTHRSMTTYMRTISR